MSTPILITTTQLKQAQANEQCLLLIKAQAELIRQLATEAQTNAEAARDSDTQNWYAGKAAAFDIAATALERALK